MSASFASEIGGRAASLARRHALSAGKAALPPATERTSAGRNAGPSPAPPRPIAAPANTASPQTPTSNPHSNSNSYPNPNSNSNLANGKLSGRQISIARRRQLSDGKAATNGHVTLSSPKGLVPTHAQPPAPSIPPAPQGTARDLSRARRAEQSNRGRGDAPPTAPTRPPRQGTLDYVPRTVASPAEAGAHVSGLRIGAGSAVTGGARGVALPVSGTQSISAESGTAWRAGGPKVGLARTARGLVVSGTLVRSRVHVTGDEAGSGIQITGEAEQNAADDLTPRPVEGAYGTSPAQFARHADPHGASVFGTTLGRSGSLRSPGSRERRLQPAIESTLGGQPVTGSALGRSLRVTGDEAGSCGRITGDQYTAPAELQAECGGRLGGTAPAAQLGARRPDPVTGAKVRVAQTWAGRPVTGIDVEHDPRVTGDAPGSCKTITGSPYQGPGTMYGWCDDGAAAAAETRLGPRSSSASLPVTGDTPRDAAGVTGTARGAARSITGTPYYAAGDAAPVLSSDPVATLDARFSVRSPQRAAQLRADAEADANAAAPSAAERITGSFAVGQDKVTGNLEFMFRPRQAREGVSAPERYRLTGEGSMAGRRITGGAYSENSKVSGTDASTAADRNPSERGGKPRAFAGAGRFKALASHEEPKHLVTGMFGYASDASAKVTLSGGAQG